MREDDPRGRVAEGLRFLSWFLQPLALGEDARHAVRTPLRPCDTRCPSAASRPQSPVGGIVLGPGNTLPFSILLNPWTPGSRLMGASGRHGSP